jgi:hypothetical protein
MKFIHYRYIICILEWIFMTLSDTVIQYIVPKSTVDVMNIYVIID